MVGVFRLIQRVHSTRTALDRWHFVFEAGASIRKRQHICMHLSWVDMYVEGTYVVMATVASLGTVIVPGYLGIVA